MQKKVILTILCLFSVNVHADWLCYTVDKNGHFWRSTGMTQDRAVAVAMSFCSAHSPDGKSCQPSKCMENI